MHSIKIKSCSSLEKRTTGLTEKLNSDPGDILIRGFWSRDAGYIVDMRICDVNQPSHISRMPETVIKSAEVDKSRNI